MKKMLYDERYRIMADYDFFYKCYLHNKVFVQIHKIISVYDKTGISANMKYRRMMYYERGKITARSKYDKSYVFRYFLNRSIAFVRSVLSLFIKKNNSEHDDYISLQSFKQI